MIVYLLMFLIVYMIVNRTPIVKTKIVPKIIRVPQRIAVPVNIRTRGEENYRQLGILHGDDKVLPLYGRRTYPGSQRWNYYTKSDGYNSFHLPIHKNGQDCTKNIGCKEIEENEKLKLNNGMFKTELYELDGPRYIPFI